MTENQSSGSYMDRDVKLEELSSFELEQLKKKTLLNIESSFKKYQEQQKLVNHIEVLIQDKCCHVWQRQMDSGPYPTRWYECVKCSKIY